ncbi:hypothetical protein [Ramlibacter montanisoli]|uniref:Uncharacterized protein n=1 Tax=Ramlibacter montanisoli TaxID=2732512 RepID=A0A849K881_9BURK|nr:hypothetical protein [Ramlibacter montanisoli]NNU42287.1 hypothetical protein [Ramlibacter montanisoli]
MQYRHRPAAFAAAALAFAALPLAVSADPALAPEQVAVRQGTANVGGLWCGAGLLREFTLEIAQHYQDVQGKLMRKARVREITGHVHGAVVKTDPQRDHTMELLAQGNERASLAPPACWRWPRASSSPAPPAAAAGIEHRGVAVGAHRPLGGTGTDRP